LALLKRLMFFSALICSSLLCIGHLNAAPVNLIQNGSFEDGSYPIGNPSYTTLLGGSSAITNWTVMGYPMANSIDWVGSHWTAADGARSIDLSGDGIGGMQQTFTTTANQQYKLTFSLAGNPDGAPTTKQMLTFGAGTLFVQNLLFDTTDRTRTAMGWTEYTYKFTALSTSTTLFFQSLTGTPYGPALDKVSVSAVPLPAAVWMLGAGLIGLVAVRRKKKISCQID
jgi:choice-of-anchor C domain-containing protein